MYNTFSLFFSKFRLFHNCQTAVKILVCRLYQNMSNSLLNGIVETTPITFGNYSVYKEMFSFIILGSNSNFWLFPLVLVLSDIAYSQEIVPGPNTTIIRLALTHYCRCNHGEDQWNNSFYLDRNLNNFWKQLWNPI